VPPEQDFERAWLAKLARRLDEVAGEEIRQGVMQGSEHLSSASSRQEVIDWTRDAMARLDRMLSDEDRQAVLLGCACQYPKSGLQPMRAKYAETGDVGVVHRMLQEQFESFLRNTLELEEAVVAEIVRRGWGAAGVLQDGTIIATKIPKSDNLLQYLREEDPVKKRQHYCHCPRIRAVLMTRATISPTYCYCGAGFYKGIWEEILQKPVRLELLKSVLAGDDVCAFAIHLPTEE